MTSSAGGSVSESVLRPVSHLGAIGFALAGFTFWVLADTSVKLVGQSGLPAYEMVAGLGLFMALFLGMYEVAGGLLMLGHAAPLNGGLVAGLAAMGLFCALGTLCFYVAVKHTSAANVSQYHYTQLLTGTLVTYLVWHEKPGLYVLLGGALIFASGLYIAMGRERLLR